MLHRAKPTANKASIGRVRSSLMMSTPSDGDARATHPRRRSRDGPRRSKSGTSMETLARRTRKRTNSKANIADERVPESTDPQWQSSSASSDESDVPMLELRASTKPKHKNAAEVNTTKPQPYPSLLSADAPRPQQPQPTPASNVSQPTPHMVPTKHGQQGPAERQEEQVPVPAPSQPHANDPVSYTHLTLPTILLV